MEQTTASQQEVAPPKGGRRYLSGISGAYARATAQGRGLLAGAKQRLSRGTARPAVDPGFARAARLTVWAPSAVFGAGIGAALVAATAVWTAAMFWRNDADIGKIIAIATFASGYILFMLLFASSPSFSMTMRRLWAGASVVLLFLGGAALLLALDMTFQHFTGTSLLGLSR